MDLFQLINDVEALVKAQADKKNLAVNLIYEYPLPTRIGTDPVRLEQILLNLCSNAIKFTHEGSVSLVISCKSSEQRIHFTVRDSGIGINENQMEKLFKPFQQADSSITRRYGGTGLGLSLSKKLAQALGGDIEVQSEPGEGSQFTLTIDTGSLLHTQFVHNISQIAINTETDRQAADSAFLSGKVLLAEDNKVNQDLLSLFLRNMGIDVTVADNGEAAVRLAQENVYELIFMDMQMPVMSGVEATRFLRNQGHLRPIIALTANASSEDKMMCMTAGCNEFLTKPVAREKLYATAAKYLEKAAGKPQPKGDTIVSTLLDEDPSFRDLVERFVSQLPALVSKLQRACEAGDWVTLKEELHSLKGVGGGVGYGILSELAEKAELQVKGENPRAVETSLEEISQVSARICAGINTQGDKHLH